MPSNTNPEGAKRNLVSISPFFIVKDLQASIAFYVDRLGFEVDFTGPADDPYYAGVSRDGIGIMLKAIVPDVLPCPNHTRHEWARWDAYIYTLDPDALFDEFTDRTETPHGELTISFRYELLDAGRRLCATEHLRGAGREQDNLWVFDRAGSAE